MKTSLVQIGRVDTLIAELLAMTQRQAPEWRTVDVAAFLRDRVLEHGAVAEAAHVVLEHGAADRRARFDPKLLGRAFDNILLNAIRHTPPGGRVGILCQC